MDDQKQPVQTWYYRLQSLNGEGWAEIMIVSTGMFAAVSAFGDYAFAWRSPGDGGIRAFLADVYAEHWDYFADKLSHGHRVWDGPKTAEAVRRFIGKERQSGAIDHKTCRAALHEVDDADEFDEERQFDDWITDSVLAKECDYDYCALADLGVHSFDSNLEQFCKQVLPRLAAVLREELTKEGAAA